MDNRSEFIPPRPQRNRNRREKRDTVADVILYDRPLEICCDSIGDPDADSNASICISYLFPKQVL